MTFFFLFLNEVLKMETPIHQVLNMERPKEFIAAVTDKKDLWKLSVRVKDKWTAVKDGKEHLELLIVDAKGHDIQLLIPTAYKSVYDKTLEVNSTYTLTNFQVLKNDVLFKVSDHKYKLIWTGGTTAVDVNLNDIPNTHIKYKPFAEIVFGKWRPDLLFNVIGVVQDMGYCQLNEGKKLQYAAKFVQYNSDRKEAGPVIVLLKYCKIKEEGFNSLLDFSCFFNYLFRGQNRKCPILHGVEPY
ncbi:putative nucleic acid-binding protein [Medicago truncatula]|uniref:Putative nucleic acid-binding protein n=1 Tax=Medicago truncatula TaxID=3880 RepID=A0A396H115_MEDTR|nr:putative nucleic acid-binding protein [Medicago truncatula]